MNTSLRRLATVVILLSALSAPALTLYVDVNSTNPVAPYTNWATAAIVIQDAIDAAVAGDTVWVTNGLYNSGGKVMAGDLANRVALDKAITLQSVNGPQFTIIEGLRLGGTNAFRVAWLTNGAVLSGFTLQRGRTRSSGDTVTLMNGAGVWCSSDSAIVTNCTVIRNFAYGSGGGVYQGSLLGCVVEENEAGANGGGVAEANLADCRLDANRAIFSGGGAYKCILTNCAVIRNTGGTGSGAYSSSIVNCTVARNTSTSLGGGVYVLSPSHFIRNSIVFGNTRLTPSNVENYGGLVGPSNFEYTCTTPLPSGPGNISVDPQLLADDIHLAESSPCRGAASTNYSSGLDIDGQLWLNPPSMGCDEWYPEPVAQAPKLGHYGGIGEVSYGAGAAGAQPFAYSWVKDGVLLSNGDGYSGADSPMLRLQVSSPSKAGAYALVASNAFGVVTGQVAQLNLHFVDASSSSPVPPYDDWASASTKIQEAIDVALDGSVVVITNGIYADGGRTHLGNSTNRVVIDKPIIVVSVNGAYQTAIQGAWNPVTTNGPLAIRCVSMAKGAVLKGFTLSNGATFLSGFTQDTQGGGVHSQQATVANCVVTNCSASQGGGAYGTTLENCLIVGNYGFTGGGTSSCQLTNCSVIGNRANVFSGSDHGSAVNSIIYFNSGSQYGFPIQIANSCTTPLSAFGTGNITNAPLFVDTNNWSDLRLQTNSPCINAGNNAYVASTTDLEGNPRIVGGTVDMGAYEFQFPQSSISYAYLQQYGLPTDGSVDDEDGDNDMATTWQEWKAWTDPTNELSVLKMLNPQPNTNSTAVSWQSVNGHSYTLERATNSAADFTVLQSGIAGQAGTTTFTDTTATNANAFLYRVSVPE